MKGKFLLLLFLFLSCGAIVSAQFRTGIDVGYVNTHFGVDNPKNDRLASESCHGIQLSAIAAYLHRDVLWLETGLSFQFRNGTSFDPNLTWGYMDAENPEEAAFDPFSRFEIITNRLELPLWAGVKIKPGKNVSIIPKGGVFLSTDIWGKGITEGVDFDGAGFRSEYNLISTSIEKGYQVNPRNYRDRLPQFDAGWQLGADVEWDKWSVRMAYRAGLVDRAYFVNHLRSRAFSVSLAYYFKR